MKDYEIVYILNANLNEDNVKEIIVNVEKLITTNGGLVTSSKNLGRKAVQANFQKMKNMTTGYFVITLFQIEGKNLKELGRRLGLLDTVLKHSIMLANTKIVEEPVEA